VVTALGSNKRPPVLVTINGHTYRSTVAVLRGRFMLGVSADNQAIAGVAAGYVVDVEMGLDTAPREVVVPPDFDGALAADPEARRAFEALNYSNRQRIVLGIEGAEAAETRQRRVEKAITTCAGAGFSPERRTPVMAARTLQSRFRGQSGRPHAARAAFASQGSAPQLAGVTDQRPRRPA
jgi:hypothetical protein